MYANDHYEDLEVLHEDSLFVWDPVVDQARNNLYKSNPNVVELPVLF